MATIVLNVDTNINIDMLIAHICMLKGVNDVAIYNNELWREDIEAWKNWSDNDETNYLKSIPGFMESLDAASNEPIEECVPWEDIWDDI